VDGLLKLMTERLFVVPLLAGIVVYYLVHKMMGG
jgi:hypothetical protein